MSQLLIGSVRSRLVLIVVLAILPALGLMLFNAATQRRLGAEQAQANAQRQAALAAADFDRAVGTTHQVLQLLAQMPEVRADVGTCERFLAELRTNYPMFGNFNVIPPSGTVRCASLPSPAPVYLGDRSYFQRALEQKTFSVGDFTIGRTTGRPSIVFALPMLDAAGEVEAVLSVGIDLTWLNRHLAEVAWPEGTTLTILDSGGTIVGSYPDFTRLGGSIRNQPEMVAIHGQREGISRRVGPDGRPVLLGFASSEVGAPAAQVHVVIGVPEDVAFAPADQQLARGVGLALIAALLALAAAWLLGDRFIARPLHRMIHTTEAVLAGDLSARTRLTSEAAELCRLAESVDELATRLQAIYGQAVQDASAGATAQDGAAPGHGTRVMDYALTLGRALGWNELQLARLQLTAAIHDADRLPERQVSVPRDRSLAANGAGHPEELRWLTPVAACALHQPEAFDGMGYPRGLTGRDIPSELRAVAVADIYDALTMDRPYRKGLTPEVALAQIRRGAGTHFDPEMVEAFVHAVG